MHFPYVVFRTQLRAWLPCYCTVAKDVSLCSYFVVCTLVTTMIELRLSTALSAFINYRMYYKKTHRRLFSGFRPMLRPCTKKEGSINMALLTDHLRVLLIKPQIYWGLVTYVCVAVICLSFCVLVDFWHY